MRLRLDKKAHWSSYGRSPSSTKTLLPFCRGPFCKGNAIRLPNPPAGMVSWLGNNRSYDSNPKSGQRSIVSVTKWAPSLRASDAGTGSEKKIQT